MYLIFLGRKTLQKCYKGRYLCNRGPEGRNLPEGGYMLQTYIKYLFIQNIILSRSECRATDIPMNEYILGNQSKVELLVKVEVQ